MLVHRSARSPKPDRAALRFEFYAAPDEAWLDRRTVAAGLNHSVSWLEKFVTKGGGPPYRPVGRRRVLYRKREVVRWFDEYTERLASSSKPKECSQ